MHTPGANGACSHARCSPVYLVLTVLYLALTVLYLALTVLYLALTVLCGCTWRKRRLLPRTPVFSCDRAMAGCRSEEDGVWYTVTVLYLALTVFYRALTVSHLALTVLYIALTVLYVTLTVLYLVLTVLYVPSSR